MGKYSLNTKGKKADCKNCMQCCDLNDVKYICK